MLPSKQEHRRASHPAEQRQLTKLAGQEAVSIHTISIFGMGRILVLIIWRGQVVVGHKGISQQ